MSKPVAWMNEYEQICHATDKRMEEIANNISSPRNYFNYTIPLYTHPVNQLSDFKILQISHCYPDRLHFAKAIIKEITE